MEMNYSSNAKGNLGVTLGAIGTGLAALNASNGGGLFSGLFGNNSNCCSENMPVSRYELSQEGRIAKLETEVALRDNTIYTDKKSLELYQYVDGRLRGVEAQIAQQAVVNAQITANISCMQGNIATLMGLTKTVVPIDNVCPQPMPQYNSWTAPTAAATT